MGSNVAEGLRQVVGTGDHTVLTHDDGTNGNLTGFVGDTGLIEGHLHVAFIFFLLFFVYHVAKVLFFGQKNKRNIKNMFLWTYV